MLMITPLNGIGMASFHGFLVKWNKLGTIGMPVCSPRSRGGSAVAGGSSSSW